MPTRIQLIKDKIAAQELSIAKHAQQKAKLQAELAKLIAAAKGYVIGKKYYYCKSGYRRRVCTIKNIGDYPVGLNKDEVGLYVFIESVRRRSFWGTMWIYPSDHVELIPIPEEELPNGN